ncbi:MAG: PD40 domain-containing protein [Chitinispirillaceae bacterium]|nr:PD40 domain-containing protein [Chitinispirillaceae bacterium]
MAITHLEWYMGLRNEFAGATLPLLSIGTFGVFSQVFTAGSDRYAFDINEQPNDFSMVEYAAGASYARSFFDRRLCTGASLYYVESRLDGEAGRALAASTDFLYSPLDWIDATFRIRHFGSGVTYHAASEPLPLQTGVSLTCSPLQTVDPDFGPFPAVTMAAGVEKTADEPVITALGIDWKPFRYLSVRCGYDYRVGRGFSIAGTSAGLGFRAGKYKIDGAWNYQSPIFGPIWAASVAMEFEPIALRTAEELEQLAAKSFSEERYKDCIIYARKALRLDPNLWKAQTLLGKAQSEILRRKKLEIAIIYSGNIRGQFLPPLQAGALGGLARQATVINTLRSQFPVALSVAAGNMVTTRSHEIKANIAHRYYRHIRHEAVCLGQGEFDYDLAWFLEADSLHQPFLCIEGDRLGHKNIFFRQVIETNGYSFAVFSAAATPEIVQSLKKRASSIPEELRLELKRHDVRKCHLRIVVLHDSWENIKGYAPSLEGADVIICGSLNGRFETPMKLGQALAVSPGSNGEFVGVLTMRFDEKKRFLSYDNRLVPVAASLPEDPAVAALLAPIALKAEAKIGDSLRFGIQQGTTRGVFPFISTRSGVPELYLKIIDKHTEFPLTASGQECEASAVSFTAGRIAFTLHDTASGCHPVYSIDLTGAGKRLLAGNANVGEAVFSPDGRWLYYTAGPCGDTVTDIYRMHPDSGVRFTVVAWDNSSERSITLSPDGAEVLFCSNRDRTWQIYRTDPEGAQPFRLTDETANHSRPSFSPDGASISYLSDRANTVGGHDLWVYERASGTHRQLTQKFFVNGYCWLGDSKTIIFSSGLDNAELMTVSIDAPAPKKLIGTPIPAKQQYQEITPRVVAYGEREKILYVRKYEDGRRSIYWVSIDGTGDQALVRSGGSDWLER